MFRAQRLCDFQHYCFEAAVTPSLGGWMAYRPVGAHEREADHGDREEQTT